MPKRYRCSIAIAIAVCLQLATGTTKAAETTYTANDLLQDCKDSLLERKVPPPAVPFRFVHGIGRRSELRGR